MFNPNNNSSGNCSARIELTDTLRRLWSQHVMWTRSFIISTAANLADLQLVTQRLLRNPGDFAQALERYYGAQNARRFKELFTDHLTIAARLVNESKQGNTAAANATRARWYRNSEDIARFLSEINPHWDYRLWRNMLFEHLKLTEQEAGLRLSGQYAADIALYDQIERQALEMADVMTDGIIRQFGL